jgi:hypothetical protein
VSSVRYRRPCRRPGCSSGGGRGCVGPFLVDRIVVRGSAWRAAIWTSRRSTPASKLVVTNVTEHVRVCLGHMYAGLIRDVPQAAGRRVTVHPRAAAIEQDRPAGTDSSSPVDSPPYCGRQWDQYDLLEEFDASDRRPDFLFPDYSRSIRITSPGWARLEEQPRHESTIQDFDRLKRLADLGLYDTAIREAGVFLETRLRTATGSKQVGIRLVDIYVRRLARERRFNIASIRRIRTDLRSAFKFIRNEFAHQSIEIPQDRALALLSRLASLIELVETNPLETQATNSLC